MKRSASRRGSRRRKAVEQAGRSGREPAQFASPTPTVGESQSNLLALIVQENAAERIELPFEIASEDDVSASEEKTNGKKAAAKRKDTGNESQTREARHASKPITETPNAGSALAADELSAEDLLYNAAREAHSQGETRRAMAIYRELLSLNPGHVRARNNLGLLLDHLGDREEALQQLEQCLRAEPDNAQVLVNRGGVLGALGRFAEAETDLLRALDQDTTNAEAHLSLGLLMSRRGLWSAALPYLRRSIELDQGRAMAYLHLGDALNHVDDLEGALQAYQRSVELVPNNAKAFYGLGIIYDRMNRPEDAQKMYRSSRELAGR